MAKYLTGAGLQKVVSKIESIISSVETALTASINTKVTAVDGKDLLATTEAEKLAKLSVTDAGVLSVANIPAAAMPTCVTVASLDEMYALTAEQVQNGDSVRIEPVDGEPIMYYVVDETQLSTEAGYKKYAAVTDWSAVTNIPAKVTSPTALSIQVNGAEIVSYTGLETDPVVANIAVETVSIDAITDDEIDAMFTLSGTTTGGDESGEDPDAGDEPESGEDEGTETV